MVEETREQAVWWGSFVLDEEQAGCWRVGPSTVWIYRDCYEWRLVHEQSEDHLESTAGVALPVAHEDAGVTLETISPAATVSRFSFHQTDERLTVSPELADRPIIIRPEKPLYVLADEDVTLYISTPLWLRIEVGDPPRLLTELPSYRPSDTWFGPSTLEGELCYASTTTGRLRLQELPMRLHRAVTPVLIRNRAADALLLDRIRLPVQHFSLYQAANDFLWTEAVTLDREKDGEQAALHLGKGAPPEAERAHLVRPPRQTSRTNVIVRTFSSFFNLIKEA